MEPADVIARLKKIVEESMVVEYGERGLYVIAIQYALLAAGHELVTDGIYGAITRTAVRSFQAARHLIADGEVGPLTAGCMLARLAEQGTAPVAPSLPSVLVVAPHLARMRAMTGIAEIPGTKSNPLIISWVREIARLYPELKGDIDWYDADAIAWCGLAMGAAVAIGTPSLKPPSGLLAAASWGRWGQSMKEPTPGAILCFSRSGGNHVTLYESEDETYFYCRGGNQSDVVNCSRRLKSQKPWAVRWPSELELPTTGRKWGVTQNAVAAAKES